MIFIKYLLFIISICTLLKAQPINENETIASISNATSFSINTMGSIYITDTEKNSVSQYNIDGESINSIGGNGWDNYTFDMPVDIFATNLKVYVADKNNHRIQIFDKDLNYITSLSQENLDLEIIFEYPTNILVTRMEDILVLDSESSRVIRYNSVGEVLSIIGDYDAGEYALENPTEMILINDDQLMVVDGTHLNIFDIFGNPISQHEINFAVKNIYFYEPYILLSKNSEIFYISMFDEEASPIHLTNINMLDEEEFIIDLDVYKDLLIVLTQNRIIKQKLILP